MDGMNGLKAYFNHPSNERQYHLPLNCYSSSVRENPSFPMKFSHRLFLRVICSGQSPAGDVHLPWAFTLVIPAHAKMEGIRLPMHPLYGFRAVANPISAHGFLSAKQHRTGYPDTSQLT